MAKKNTDAKGFNRTGVYNHEEGTITFTDAKENVTVFNIKAILASLDGEEISLTATTDMNPSHVIGEDDENGE